MRRIRQGQSRWRLDVICGNGGHADVVYIYHCIVMKVGVFSIRYFDGHEARQTSHWGWLQMYPTRRKAWAAAWRMVRKTDSIRNAEYVEAWRESPATEEVNEPT